MYSHSYFNPEMSRRLIPLLLILGAYVIIDLKRDTLLKSTNIVRFFTDVLILFQLVIVSIFSIVVGISSVSISPEIPRTYNFPCYFAIMSIIIGGIIFCIGCYQIIKNCDRGHRRKLISKYFIISIIVITVISSYQYSLKKYIKPDNYYHKIVSQD